MTWREAVTALREGPLPLVARKVIAARLEPFAKAEADRERAQIAASHDPNDPTCECAWCWQELECGGP
jgi:hypothetical protein